MIETHVRFIVTAIIARKYKNDEKRTLKLARLPSRTEATLRKTVIAAREKNDR